MADGEGLFSGLSNLPIFEGRPEDEVRRALLATGLGLMQPQNPLTGGAVTQLTGGIQAGLESLDTTEAKRLEQDAARRADILRGREVTAEEERARAATTTAEAAATSAEGRVTAASEALAEEARQFDALEVLRASEIDLNTANAEWLRRRFGGDPSTAARLTAAGLDRQDIEARIQNLYRANPERYSFVDENGVVTKNIALLTEDAFNDHYIAKGIITNENLPIIARDPADAERLRQRIRELQGIPEEPAADFQDIVQQQQQDNADQLVVQSMQTWTAEEWQQKIDLPPESEERKNILRLVSVPGSPANAAFGRVRGQLTLK